MVDAVKSGGTSVLTSRKSSSTPSLPDATENHTKASVASTEQAASADNLAAKVAVILILFGLILSDIVLEILSKHHVVKTYGVAEIGL